MSVISTVSKVFFIIVSIIACLAVCGCDEPAPTPAPTAQGPSLETMMADFGIYDEPATADDLTSSRNTLNAAVDALERGDKIAFMGTLSSDLMPAFESADDSLAKPAALADAIRRAVVAESYSTAIVYTTVVNGKTFEIILVPEDGTWKIDEL